MASTPDAHPQSPTHSKDAGQPVVTLELYRRLFQGRKHFFVDAESSHTRYFIINPVPHRHSNTWKPVFYRGDNPKWSPGTIAIGRARRAVMWSSISVWLGDGVEEQLDNKRRKNFKKSVARKARCRRWFCMKPKPPKGPLEDEQEVCGKVILVQMRRRGVTRAVEFELDGVRYRWSGTRRFAYGWMKRSRGWFHSMKLVRLSDHAVIATFEKDRWATFRRAEKIGSRPNKNRSIIGRLRIYEPADTTDPQFRATNGLSLSNFTAKVDDLATGTMKQKDEKNTNPSGSHAGNLKEEAIAFTCWIAVEGEHRIRYKIVDLLEEVGEEAGG